MCRESDVALIGTTCRSMASFNHCWHPKHRLLLLLLLLLLPLQLLLPSKRRLSPGRDERIDGNEADADQLNGRLPARERMHSRKETR